MTVLWALLAGGALGTVFALLGLPVPAPPKLEGVAGILGITLAYIFVMKAKQ